MDRDPELDVILSNGRRVLPFQIAPGPGTEAWTIVEPGLPPRVIRGEAEAVAIRQRLDARIAARLAAGWVPVDRRATRPPFVAPMPLPPDLVLQISHLLEALTRGRAALRAADPSGQLWAACHVFRQQAWRVGVSGPTARVLRARQERRLGELAEQAGDRAAAIACYRLALASCARVGVARRLRHLEAHEPCRDTGQLRAWTDSTGLSPSSERPCGGGQSRPPRPGDASMKTARIQIVGRLPVELSRRVRAAAHTHKVSLNTFLIDALTRAVERPRRAVEAKAASLG